MKRVKFPLNLLSLRPSETKEENLVYSICGKSLHSVQRFFQILPIHLKQLENNQPTWLFANTLIAKIFYVTRIHITASLFKYKVVLRRKVLSFLQSNFFTECFLTRSLKWIFPYLNAIYKC